MAFKGTVFSVKFVLGFKGCYIFFTPFSAITSLVHHCLMHTLLGVIQTMKCKYLKNKHVVGPTKSPVGHVVVNRHFGG